MHVMPRTSLIGFVICLTLCSSVFALSFDRFTTFKSSEDFIASLKALRPQKESNVYSRALSIEDFGEGGLDALIVPEKVESVTEVWRGTHYALVFATARPKTGGSQSEAAILIILLRDGNGSWRFSDMRRYQTIGKYAEITCELTSAGYKEYVPGQSDFPATVTFKRHSGGRGASESTAWSLLFQDGALYDHK